LLLAISDRKQAEHSLEEKKSAVEQELAFLIRDFQSIDQIQSNLFIKESVQIFVIAMKFLSKNKLNFDTEKCRQQQGEIGPADDDFLIKRLNQSFMSTQKNYLKPALKKHCQETGNAERLDFALSELNQQLDILQSEFEVWVTTKTRETI
jgi:hypothetical protein